MRINAPRCTLGVVVAALFLAVTWSTTAARYTPTRMDAAVEPTYAPAPTPKRLSFRPSVFYATVTTDKAGYLAGDTVVVSGTGWQPGETVHLTYDETPFQHLPHEADAIADSSGNISSAEYVIEPHDSGTWFVLTAAGLSSGLTAETRFSDANLVVDFRQGANNEKNGTVTGLGNIHWINSIIQVSNSKYLEGMGVFQRTIFTDVPATTGNVHTLTFRHEFTKAGIHAYDFLVSYDQAIQNDHDALGVAIQLNACGVEIGPPGSLATTCTSLRSGPFADVTVPDDPYISKDGSLQSRINAYEASNGNRTIRIWGPAAITNTSLTVCHDVANGADTADSFSLYTLKWTSTSSDLLIEMAGHLAISGDGTGDTWGVGLGSSQISGGPYHFKLDELGGAITNSSTCPETQSEVTSLGSQDNQIKGADILVPCPTCSVGGSTGPFCPGSAAQTYTVSVVGTCTSQSTVTWTLSNNTSGASFVGGVNTGTSVSVNPGTTCGSFTLTSSFTCANCTTPVTCSISPTVVDTTPPVLTGCPSDSTVQCRSDVGAAPTVTALDNCDGPVTVSFTETESSPGSSCHNTITRTWSATDHCGNTASCTQHITVNDTTPPTITCPGPLTFECESGVPALNPSDATATDNCGTATVTATRSSSGTCPKIITDTFTATDGCGNTASCTRTITIQDKTAPVLSGCPSDATVQCFSDVPAKANVTATDNCDGAITPTFNETQSNPGSSCHNVITRTWTATDRCGNTASCTQHITVNDTTAPVLSGCPTDASVQCLSDVPAKANVTANDNCDGAITPTFSETQSKPGSSCNNVITRTWTATDRCGNTASCTQHITVNDTTPPTITCPGDLTFQCDSDVPAANPSDATATDNCGTPTVTVSRSSTGTCPKIITDTFTATDSCGNTASCTRTITVHDTTKPVLSGCPTDATVQCLSDVPGRATVTANDNCDGAITPSFSETQSNPGSSCNNVITRTWTATDRCGNTASCTQHITVNDTTPPAIVCPGNIERGHCNNTVTYTTTATDNCGTPTLVCSPASGTVFPDGVTLVTCTATDSCNNSASCSFSVTVFPQPSCSINLPTGNPVCGSTGNTLSATVSCLAGGCTTVWSVASADAGWQITGGQGTPSITYNAGASHTPATFTLVVTDRFGCQSTCSIQVDCSPPQQVNCTLTQGFYGNQNGKFNGISGTTLVAGLLTTDLTVGKLGVRSLTIKGGADAASSAQCLVKRMPATQAPSCLPNFGDKTLSGFASCDTNPPIPKNGQKWSNVLLGQVVTLSLNIRLDAANHEDGHTALADREICNTFVTQGSLAGPDGVKGTADDVIDPSSAPSTSRIPLSVTCALTHLGLPHTVGGILELGNRALACQCIDVASLADVNQAVDAINSGFDECRFLVSCTDSPDACPPAAPCTTAASLLTPNKDQLAQSFSFESAPVANLFELFQWNADRSFLGSVTLLDAEHNPTYFRFGLRL